LKHKKEAEIEKNLLIKNIHSAILSTSNKENINNASYAPIGVDKNNNFYIYVSELAKHTQNILENPSLSLMLIEDESNATNIFARKRLTINGDVSVLEREADDWYAGIQIMQLRFRDHMKFLLDMTDFHLIKIVPKDALLVYGFAKAFRFEGQKLSLVNHMNDKGHTMKNKTK
jgi:hypothetical protein